MSTSTMPVKALGPPAAPEPPLRSYQQEMLRYGSSANTLVVLNTGTGKTRIAVELIRQHSQQLIARSQVAVFLTPSVPLGAQQADVLRAAGIPTETAFGEMAQQGWGSAEWSAVLQSHLALVMTPDVFVACLSHAMVKMDNVGLLVFDEVHHCGKNHSYAVAQQAFYHAQAPGRKPRVLGLTASPGSSGLQVLQADTDSLIVAPRRLVEVEALIPRPKPEWVLCEAGSLAVGNASIAAALLEVQEANSLMGLVVNYVGIKENMQTRARFEQDVLGGENASGFADVRSTGSGPSLKDVDHIKKQIGGVQDALQQLGPWPACVVLAMDLLSSICKLPADFGDLKLYMLAELMDRGDLGPAVSEATNHMQVFERQLELQLSGSPFRSCRELLRLCTSSTQPAGAAGLPSTAVLEEVAVRHVLLTMLQALAQLLAASPDQVQRIVQGAEAAMSADPNTGVLELRNEGHLEQWGMQVLQLVPAEALQQQVLGVVCPSGSEGARWLSANGTPLVDPKVQTMVKLVKQVREGGSWTQPEELPEGEYGPYISWAALVFATRKTTCLALDQLFKAIPQLAPPAFATSMFVGNTDLATGSAPMSMTHKKQEAIRVGFGSGHLNVLFATTVGSEGLDFRQCQLVLAFDMPPNVVQLVQSGGRARAHQSRYIILQDPSQRKAVTKLLSAEQQMMAMTAELARSNMASIDQGAPNDPVQAMLQVLPGISAVAAGRRPGDTSFMAEERRDGAYCVPSTGARCLPSYAQQLLQMYIHSLPGNDRYSMLQPYYAYHKEYDGMDSCTIYLPNNAALAVVKPVASLFALKKDDAKTATCLSAVKQLHQLGVLDDYLRPCRDHTHSRTLAQSLTSADVKQLEHRIPQVLLPETLPAGLQLPAEQQQQQRGLPASCTAYLYSFEVVGDSSASPPPSPSQSFGITLPQALPVDRLPAFEVVQRSSPAGDGSGRQWVRVCSWGAVQLSAAQLSCLEASQEVYQALMLDVLHPKREPWQHGPPVRERLQQWEALMGFAQLRQALAALDQGSGAVGAAGAGERKHVWYSVPLQCGAGGSGAGDKVDWAYVRTLSAGPTALAGQQAWQEALGGGHGALESQLQGHRMLIALHSGRLYVWEGLRPDLHPDSPFDDLSKAPTFIEYFRTRWGVSEPLDTRQPLLQAEWSSGRGTTNLLPIHSQSKAAANGAGSPPAASTRSRVVNLVPQLVALHPMSLQHWQALHSLPSLMYRLESMLSAQQLMLHLRSQSVCQSNFLGGVPELEAVRLTLVAVTSTNCNEAYDLELPELLGDAVIKHAVSVHGYLISDGDRTAHEGALSCWRELFISNEVLLRKGVNKLKLDRALRMRAFDLERQMFRGRLGGMPQQARDEDAMAVDEEGQCQEAQGGLMVKGKRLADSVEALIGVHCWPALQQHLRDHPGSPTTWSSALDQAMSAASSFMAAAGLLPADLKVMPAGAGGGRAAEHQAKRARLNAKDRAALDEVQAVLQYRFSDTELALQALTHCSYPSVTRGSYQRLEYLGDAVLGLLVTVYLVLDRHCELSSGEATNLRSDLVSNEALASVCLHWGLQTHLKVGAKALGQAIHSWAKHAEYQQQGLGVATAASTQAPGSGVGSEAEEELEEEVAPKALADLVEALVGAVFVDSGGDMQATMKVVARLLRLDQSQAGGASAAPMPSSRRMVPAGQKGRGSAPMPGSSVAASSLMRGAQVPARSVQPPSRQAVPSPVRQSPQQQQPQQVGRGASIRRSAGSPPAAAGRLGGVRCMPS